MKISLFALAAISIPLLVASDTRIGTDHNLDLAKPINTTPIQEPPKELLAMNQIPVKPSSREAEPPKITDEKAPSGMSSLAVMATSYRVAGLELSPPESTIPSTKRFIIISAKAVGKVKWFVTNVNQQQPVEWLEIPNTKSIMVFPTYDSDDKISAYAYTVVSGEPSDLAKATIAVVRRTAPIPIPTPEPPSPIPAPLTSGAKLHLTIITDASLQRANPALAGIIDGKPLADKLSARGHKKWVLDQNVDQEIIKNKGFDEFIRQVGKIPIYIVQDNNGTERGYGPLPTSADGIIAVLDKVSPPKTP